MHLLSNFIASTALFLTLPLSTTSFPLPVALDAPAALPAAQLAAPTNLGRAAVAINALNQKWWDRDAGTWQDLWWQSGNVITTLAEFTLFDPEALLPQTLPIFETTFIEARKAYGGNFLNAYFDDEAWWALAWIRVYDATGDRKFLTEAENLFSDMHGAPRGPCGGYWWMRAGSENITPQINAITNQLYFSVAAALANRVPHRHGWYAQNADEQHAWLMDSALHNDQGFFNDSLNLPDCNHAHGPAFTYTQGVITGALVEYAELTSDPSHLDTAAKIVDTALGFLTSDNGILEENQWGGPLRANPTPAMFKGIFVRNLAALQRVAPQERYAEFLRNNAGAVWAEHGEGRSEGLFGPEWQDAEGEGGDATASSQGAAVDAFVAAASV